MKTIIAMNQNSLPLPSGLFATIPKIFESEISMLTFIVHWTRMNASSFQNVFGIIRIAITSCRCNKQNVFARLLLNASVQRRRFSLILRGKYNGKKPSWGANIKYRSRLRPVCTPAHLKSTSLTRQRRPEGCRLCGTACGLELQ